MKPKPFFIGRAIGFAIILIVAPLVAGFYILNNYIYQAKQGEGDGTELEPYRATLTGEYRCLGSIWLPKHAKQACAQKLEKPTQSIFI